MQEKASVSRQDMALALVSAIVALWRAPLPLAMGVGCKDLLWANIQALGDILLYP